MTSEGNVTITVKQRQKQSHHGKRKTLTKAKQPRNKSNSKANAATKAMTDSRTRATTNKSNDRQTDERVEQTQSQQRPAATSVFRSPFTVHQPPMKG